MIEIRTQAEFNNVFNLRKPISSGETIRIFPRANMEKAYNCNILCSEDACVICGDYVPEGQQVCPACKKDPQQVLKE